MCTITLSDKFTYGHFIPFCEQINNSMEQIINNRTMVLDLTNVSFIDPFGMISMIGACRHLFNMQEVQSKILRPGGKVGHYMERMGFLSLEETNPFIEVKRSFNFRFESLGMILRGNNNSGLLTFFQSEKDIRDIMDTFESWMEKNGYDDDERSRMSPFISEMVQNVCQHSKTPQLGVLCAQEYRPTNGNPFFAWAVGDAGVGIRQSLLDADVSGIAQMTDSDAIQEVLKGRSSIQDNMTRGNGFPRLLNIVKQRSATLFIHSNNGIFGWNTRGMRQRKMVADVTAISGTTVSFIIG